MFHFSDLAESIRPGAEAEAQGKQVGKCRVMSVRRQLELRPKAMQELHRPWASEKKMGERERVR